MIYFSFSQVLVDGYCETDNIESYLLDNRIANELATLIIV